MDEAALFDAAGDPSGIAIPVISRRSNLPCWIVRRFAPMIVEPQQEFVIAEPANEIGGARMFDPSAPRAVGRVFRRRPSMAAIAAVRLAVITVYRSVRCVQRSITESDQIRFIRYRSFGARNPSSPSGRRVHRILDASRSVRTLSLRRKQP